MQATRRVHVALLLALMVFPALACNLLPATEQVTPAATVAVLPTLPNDGTRPVIAIVEPAPETQFVVRQPFAVRIQATDAFGITRVEMREAGRIVVQQPSPPDAPTKNFEALLPYTPTNTGSITLEVVAYRNSVGSEPMSIRVQIVGTEGEVSNPGTGGGTPDAASAFCTVRVNVSNLNLRSGPSTSFQVLTKLTLGEDLPVIGRNADRTWLQVRRAGVAQDGWLSAQFVQQNGDCGRAPVINVP